MSVVSERPAFLAAWAACARRGADKLDDDVLTQARRSWVDTAAVTLGGSRERSTQAAVEAARFGNEEGAFSPADAALVLGTASHALDYDDVCMLATCHPSAPVISALLGLLPAIRIRRPGIRLDEMLGAYVVGVETMLRLGEWLGFRHYALGFHATDTLGVVGATAACAHALRLAEDQSRAALAIAASSAGGLRANFGTDTKPLHVGFAASAAVRAVMLAGSGANGSDDVWLPTGFPHAYNGGESVAPLAWTGDAAWALVTPGFEHKRFPSCYLTHRLIAGLINLRGRQAGEGLAFPDAIEIEVPKNGLAALKYPAPVTGLEGKFSAEYCAAAAWMDGTVNLASFTDAAVNREPVRALMAKIRVRERTDPREKLESAPVLVRTLSGQGVSELSVDWAPGSAADPMSTSDLEAKLGDCVRHAAVEGDAVTVRLLGLLDTPRDFLAIELLTPLRRVLLGAATRASGNVKA